MADITHPLIDAYSKRCRADFVVLDEPRLAEKLKLPTYERFQIFDLLEVYDQIAFVDTDILIATDAPSVFDLVGRDQFAAVSEETYVNVERDKRVTEEILGRVEWINPYFNAGMMVLGRDHKNILDYSRKELLTWATGDFRGQHINLLNDQPYINHRVNQLGIKMVDLGRDFNHTCAVRETETRFNSFFIHYSGPSGHRYGTKLAQLRMDRRVLENRLMRRLSRRCLLCRWVLDRLHWRFVKAAFQRRVLGQQV